MLVGDVLEEIIERLNVVNPNHGMSVPSILRKITQARDNVIRNFGPAQRQSESVVAQYDIIQDQAQYPIPCPAGNVVEVEVKGLTSSLVNRWFRLPYRQFDERYYRPYYYFLNGTIGLFPKPYTDVPEGLKIFHVPVLSALSEDAINGPTGLDPQYDMVLVYGVLKEVTTGPQQAQYLMQYERWLNDYVTANNGFERYVIEERWC